MKLPSLYSAGIDDRVIDHIRTSQPWDNYFKTIRDGPTGVGMTFESLCGIAENNTKAPDLYGAEIKAKRADSDALLTLVTKNPPRAVRALTMRFGTDTYEDDGQPKRKRLYHTIKNGHSPLFSLEETDDDLLLKNVDEVVARWSDKVLGEALSKLTDLCLIDATSKNIDGVEHFRYSSFTYYHGFNQQRFVEYLLKGEAYIDLRAHYCYRKGALRDHGTAFRIDPQKLSGLYQNATRVDLV